MRRDSVFKILGEIQHQRVIAGLTGQRGAASARQNPRYLVVARQPAIARDDVRRRGAAPRRPKESGDNSKRRSNRARATARVEADLAFDPAPEFGLKGGNRNLPPAAPPLSQPGNDRDLSHHLVALHDFLGAAEFLERSTLPTTGLISSAGNEAHGVDQFRGFVAEMRAQEFCCLFHKSRISSERRNPRSRRRATSVPPHLRHCIEIGQVSAPVCSNTISARLDSR